MKMNKEVKAKWLKALRSKKAKQVTGQLKEVDAAGTVLGHCCLGILCEVHQETHPRFKWGGDGAIAYGVELTESVMKWAGIGTGECATLARMNDHQGADFRTIANYISKEY